MALFGKKDPVKEQIKELKGKQRENQLDLMFSGATPGDEKWKAADERGKAIVKEIRKLERGR